MHHSQCSKNYKEIMRMKGILNLIKMFISISWQSPQFILGILLMAIFSRDVKNKYPVGYAHITVVQFGSRFRGISLGPWIFVDSRPSHDVVKHELGHSIQSLMLGPLYLLVIGIPSLTMNIISRLSMKYYSGKYASNYYRRWPENWADRLGKVSRE